MALASVIVIRFTFFFLAATAFLTDFGLLSRGVRQSTSAVSGSAGGEPAEVSRAPETCQALSPDPA